MASFILNDNFDLQNEGTKLCEICTKSQNKEVWMSHLKLDSYMEKKEFTCVLCSLLFTDLSELADHYHSMHLAKPPWKCQLCQEQFLCVRNWMEHQMSLPKNRRRRKKNDAQGLDHESNYGCPYSNGPCIGAKLREAEVIHQRKERFANRVSPNSFNCSICEKKFLRDKDFQYHLRTHKDLEGLELPKKPYACDICGLKFAYQLSVTKHKQTHLPKRKRVPTTPTHKCTMCRSCFVSFDRLKKHILSRHLAHTQLARSLSVSATQHSDRQSLENCKIKHTVQRTKLLLESDKTVSLNAASETERGIHDDSIIFPGSNFEAISEIKKEVESSSLELENYDLLIPQVKLEENFDPTESGNVDLSEIPEIKLENDFDSSEFGNNNFPEMSDMQVEVHSDLVE